MLNVGQVERSGRLNEHVQYRGGSIGMDPGPIDF